MQQNMRSRMHAAATVWQTTSQQAQEMIDELQDLGLTHGQACDVIAWHTAKTKSDRQVIGGVLVIRLLEHLLSGHTDSAVRIKLAGIAFAYKLEHLAGYDSQAEAADRLGCSQQAISDAMGKARRAMEG